MKKIILTSALLLCFLSVGVAQSKKKLNTKRFASDLCECMNKVFGNLHPVVREMFVDMSNGISESEVQKKIENHLLKNPKDQEAIDKSIAALDNVDKQLDEKCGDMKKKYGEDPMGNEQDKAKVFEQLQKNQKCALALAIMKMGGK